jgi:CO/xanthine dehydrogenase Mo-binding subunit
MGEQTSIAHLSRRGLLKGGGALVIGFSLAGKVSAQFGPPQGPDLQEIDSWIAIHADNTATIMIGYVELGQGCTTSLPQVAAEELDLGMDQVRTIAHETEVTPNQGGTYSSSAIARGRPQVQAAAAEARLELLKRASDHLGAPIELLSVERGIVSAGPRSVTYGELVGDTKFEVAFTGNAQPKASGTYRIVGSPAVRRDLAEKVMGAHSYVQHIRLPGMLHARIIRPRGQGAYGSPPKLVSVDGASITDLPGVKIVREQDFLAVVAPREWDAVKAARQLKVEWKIGESLPEQAKLFGHMREHVTEDRVVLEEGNADRLLDGETLGGPRSAMVVQSEFLAETPYQAHAPMAPNCAVADVRDGKAMVYAPSQDIYALRGTLAGFLGLERHNVTVQYKESAGTYGHSLYDDVAMGAALISQKLGVPIRLQYDRHDEHGWDTFGPAHIGKVRIGASENGKIAAYSYEGWQHSWSFTEGNDQLAKGTPGRDWPMGPSRSVNPAVCGGMYTIASRKLTDHVLPGAPYFRGAWLRSPLDLSFAFTSEQAVDDLAAQVGIDPVDFRRLSIAGERWLGVLDAAAKASGWGERTASSSQGNVVRGRGVGLGTHLAGWGGAVAEVEVDKASGKVRVVEIWGALDAGCAVNPNIVEAQINGQLVQTVSRMLHEEVTFSTSGVTSLDWNSYPIARFSDCPKITPIVVQRIDEPSSGAGEEVMAAAAAAIANAFFDATGKRMRTFPFTPERVKAALAN